MIPFPVPLNPPHIAASLGVLFLNPKQSPLRLSLPLGEEKCCPPGCPGEQPEAHQNIPAYLGVLHC